MISLIAVDMDGTLLDEQGNIPARFDEVFRRLDEKKILFTVASGRQYNTLLNNFKDVSDRIVFITDNGTFVVYQGIELYSRPIPMKNVLELCSLAKTIPNSAAILCGRKSAYIERSRDAKQAAFLDEIARYHTKMDYVDAFESVDDDILKFTVCSFDGAEKAVYPVFSSYAGSFSISVSGEYWMDITQPDTNKGIALAHIQEYFGISRDETMAFGDFLNDVELLQNAKYSYAMANSHPDLFRYANFRAPANNEDGVLRQIVHMLDNPDEYT